MEQERSTQTVYFKDLFFAVLYKWKWLLIAAVIGGLLLGGMEMLTSGVSTTLDPVTLTPEMQIKIDQLRTTQTRLEENIESLSDYIDNSILMTLDPYHAYSCGFYLYTTAETEDPAMAEQTVTAICREYYAYLISPEVMEHLAAEFHMDARYMRELFSYSFSGDNCLSVTVRGRSTEEAQSMAEAAAQLAQDQTVSVTQTLGAHTVSIIPVTMGSKIDFGLYDTQNTTHQKLTTMKNTLTSTITELKKLAPTELTSGDTQPLLFGAVGAFLGVFLVAALACVGHLASSRVYSARMLKDRTGLCLLGCIGAKKHGPIDRWLRKLEGRATEADAEAVAANIANRCKDISKLLLLGNCNASHAEALTRLLDQQKVDYTLCTDPARSAQSINALAQCDGVVLVETCGKSVYDQVLHCKDTAEEYGKPIIGCVVIEG